MDIEACSKLFDIRTLSIQTTLIAGHALITEHSISDIRILSLPQYPESGNRSTTVFNFFGTVSSLMHDIQLLGYTT